MMHIPSPDQIQAYAAAITALTLALTGLVGYVVVKVIPLIRELIDAVDGNTANRIAQTDRIVAAPSGNVPLASATGTKDDVAAALPAAVEGATVAASS